MSVVTSALIFVDYAPEEVRRELTRKFWFDDRRQRFNEMSMRECGGEKAMQSDVYAAGFSHLGGDELEEWFRALPWGKVGSAVLICETEILVHPDRPHLPAKCVELAESVLSLAGKPHPDHPDLPWGPDGFR